MQEEFYTQSIQIEKLEDKMLKQVREWLQFNFGYCFLDHSDDKIYFVDTNKEELERNIYITRDCLKHFNIKIYE